MVELVKSLDRLAAYEATGLEPEEIYALRAQLEQPKTPCDLCIYGGKHLGAPTCAPHLDRLGCPAHPRPAGGEV